MMQACVSANQLLGVSHISCPSHARAAVASAIDRATSDPEGESGAIGVSASITDHRQYQALV